MHNDEFYTLKPSFHEKIKDEMGREYSMEMRNTNMIYQESSTEERICGMKANVR